MSKDSQISRGWRNTCLGLKDLSIGIAKLLNYLIHKYPYVFLTLELAIFLLIFITTIIPARSERDKYQQAEYQQSVKLEQLQIKYDSLNARNK